MKTKLYHSLILIVYVIGCWLIPVKTLAYDALVDGIYYNFLDNETAEVTNNKHVHSGDYSGDVVIPESFVFNGIIYSVTSIGENAFYECIMLTSVEIPNSVTSIGSVAFSGCTGLTSVEIPNSVTSIGSGAFSDCTGLTSVTISNSVTSIDGFSGCTGLTSVTIPNSVTSIDQYAFSHCTGLTSISIPISVTNIGCGAFSHCTGLTSVTIPNSVTSIDGYAFGYCTGLTSILVDAGNSIYDSRNSCNAIIETATNKLVVGCKNTIIPNSVTIIGGSAFEGCTGLTSVTIPNSVTNIYGFAFKGCTGLNSVTIPNIVTSIGGSAFEGCTGLTSVTIPNSVTSIVNNTFEGCTGLTSVTIPNSVTSIGEYAFSGCTGLTSVTIPNSVTWIGERAFFCPNLLSIYVKGETPASICTVDEYGNDLPTFLDVDKSACVLYVPKGCKSAYENAEGWKEFQNIEEEVLVTGSCGDNVTYTIYSDMTMVISGTGAMTHYVIDSDEFGDIIIDRENNDYWTQVKTVKIKEGVTSIGTYAFAYCPELTSVTIPSSVTEIGHYAFEGCTSLASVSIPSSVTIIQTCTFQDCTSLASVTIPSSVTEIEWGAFKNCTSLASLTIPSNVTIIGASAFENTAWYNNQPDGLVYAGNVAYQYKGEMPEGTSITIRNGTVSISENAFYECGGLTSVMIPSSVTWIGHVAFSGCSGLTSVTIPSSVTAIGFGAFSRCTGLTSVTIPNGVTEISEETFYGCTSLASVTIPNSVTVIGDHAFHSCSSLTSVTIPNSVTWIGEMAFSCPNLSSIYVNGETPASLSTFIVDPVCYTPFSGVDKSACVLYVPKGCKSAYENAEGWKEFQNIVELGEEPNTDISTLDNAIYVEQTDGRIGGTMDIPVKLKNSYPVRGFQFNLELPEGATINGWELSTSRMPEGATFSDMIATKKIDGNKIQVACSLNYGDATFTGNDGEIATVNVTFSEGMEEGTYPIYLTACDLTTAGGIDEDLSDVTSTLVLEDYIVGDANGDGKIRIGDATTILNYIVGTASDNFNEKAADANGDGKIRIGDATTILNIIVNQ